MTSIYDFIITMGFTYSFVFVFKKIGGYRNINLNLEIKYIFIISIIDIVLANTTIKPIRLGVYYMLLEVFIYSIYGKKQYDFFISYVLTFWVYQVSDILTGLILYKNTNILKFLNINTYFYTIASYILVIFIVILLSNLVLKLNNINKSVTVKENKLLFIYTNIIIIVYMLLIYYYNNTNNKQNMIIISIVVLCFFLYIIYFMFIVLNKLYIEKNERNYIEMYNQMIEESLNNMRSFKHDHKNIVISISGFLESNDIDGLKKYFYANIAKNEYIDNENLIGLINIKNSPIKGLIYTKISNAISKGINININIENNIDNFIIKDIDACKIMGILIDNAIESSVESEQKILNIGVE